MMPNEVETGKVGDKAFKFDEPVKSRDVLFFVIPAKAGIYKFQTVMDSRLRGSDTACDFLRNHQP